MNGIKITTLSSDNWQEYKNLRLQALKENPEAFGMNYEDAVKFPDQEWIQQLEQVQNGESSWLLFAKLDEQLIGMMGGQTFKSDDLQDTAKIVAVFVTREVRGKGIGKKLLLQLLEEFRKNPKFKKARVKVFTGQTSAIHLYKSAGFQIIDEITETWPSGRVEQTYIMERPL